MFIHVVANGKIPFLRLIFHCFYLYTYICHIFFIHLSIYGLLDSICILAIINNVALNIEVHVSFLIKIFIFFRDIPRNKHVGSCGSSVYILWLYQSTFSYYSSVLSFLRTLCKVFHSHCAKLHPHQQFPFLHSLSSIDYL